MMSERLRSRLDQLEATFSSRLGSLGLDSQSSELVNPMAKLSSLQTDENSTISALSQTTVSSNHRGVFGSLLRFLKLKE